MRRCLILKVFVIDIASGRATEIVTPYMPLMQNLVWSNDSKKLAISNGSIPALVSVEQTEIVQQIDVLKIKRPAQTS